MYSREDYLDPNVPPPPYRETVASLKPQPEAGDLSTPSPNAPGIVRRFSLGSWLSIYGRDCYQDFVRESDYANLERENAKLRDAAAKLAKELGMMREHMIDRGYTDETSDGIKDADAALESYRALTN